MLTIHSISPHFQSVWKSSQALSELSEKESCCYRCGFHKAMDESSHTSTLDFTRSFPAVVQGTGAESAALQLLSEPPVPGTWEEAVAVSKEVHLCLHCCSTCCVCLPGGLPTLWASRAACSCHTAQYGQGVHLQCTSLHRREKPFVCWLCVKPPCTPVQQ